MFKLSEVNKLNAEKFNLRCAKKSSSPKKYLVYATILNSESNHLTAREIQKKTHLKLSTVRTYLIKLFHEAEIDKIKDYHLMKYVYGIELEYNEQPTILNCIFCDSKMKSNIEHRKLINKLRKQINLKPLYKMRVKN